MTKLNISNRTTYISPVYEQITKWYYVVLVLVKGDFFMGSYEHEMPQNNGTQTSDRKSVKKRRIQQPTTLDKKAKLVLRTKTRKEVSVVKWLSS